MAEFITAADVRVLDLLAKALEGRNIIGQARPILRREDADLAVATLRKVALRVREIGGRYPHGVPTPPVSEPIPDDAK